MTRIQVRMAVVYVASMVLCVVGSAHAQVIGTFKWQTQPFCNLITLTVVQVGGMFQLTGADDLCGAGTAPTAGTAAPSGANVAFGMVVALPSGRSAHISSTINLASLSGTWTDADGTAGTFLFTPTSTGGTPRPVPTSSGMITAAQLAPTVYAGTGSATTLARSDHVHDERYYTKAASDTAFVAKVDLLRAVINQNGDLVQGLGVVSSQRLFEGAYEVVFFRNVTGCTLSATASALTTDRVATVAYRLGVPNGVFVLSQTLAAANVDNAFHLLVVCP